MKTKSQLKIEARKVRTATGDVALRAALQSVLEGIIDTLGVATGDVTWTQIINRPTNPSDAGFDTYTQEEIKALIAEAEVTNIVLTANNVTLKKENGDVVVSVPIWNQDTTGNAATATKLQTARKIWGRLFDGTADITGAIEDATDGHFSGKVTADSVEITRNLKVSGAIETDKITSKGGFDGADNSDLQEGFSLSVKTNGQGQKYSQLDVFNANIHGKLSVETLEIRETEYVKGEQVITVGGGFKCTKVEDVLTDGAVSGVKCYFLQKDSEGNERHNAFKSNDLAYCKNWEKNASGNPSRYFWRKVTDVGTDYIVVAYSENDIATNTLLGDKPIVGDTIVQLGTCGTNASGNARNKTIVLSSVRSGAPCLVMYENVHDWQWGDPTSKISPEEVLFIAEKFKIATSSGNKTLSAIMEEYNTKFQNINSQLDESFQIWHVDYNAPTNSSGAPVAPTIETYEPSKYWASTTYSEHEGDFIVTLDGIVYEFVKLDEIWQWKIVTDKYLVSAVTQINSINATLDNMASDSVITREEYPSLKKIWEKEENDYATLTAKAEVYDITTENTYYNAYVSSYSTLSTLMGNISNGLLSNESVDITDAWESAWNTYWSAKTYLDMVFNETDLGVKSELSSGIDENGDAIQALEQTVGNKSGQGLVQRMKTAEGTVSEMHQTLYQEVYGYTYNQIAQKVSLVDGEIDEAKNEIYSSMEGNYAKISTSVKKDRLSGKVSSDIILSSDRVTIDCENFKVTRGGNVSVAGKVTASQYRAKILQSEETVRYVTTTAFDLRVPVGSNTTFVLPTTSNTNEYIEITAFSFYGTRAMDIASVRCSGSDKIVYRKYINSSEGWRVLQCNKFTPTGKFGVYKFYGFGGFWVVSFNEQTDEGILNAELIEETITFSEPEDYTITKIADIGVISSDSHILDFSDYVTTNGTPYCSDDLVEYIADDEENEYGVAIPTNTSSEARNYTFRVFVGEDATKYVDLSFTQRGAGTVYTIAKIKDFDIIEASGASIKLSDYITTNGSLKGFCDFATVLVRTPGGYYLEVSENDSTEARTATIRIKLKQDSEKYLDFTITQLGKANSDTPSTPSEITVLDGCSVSGNNQITVTGVEEGYTLVYIDSDGNELSNYEEITK